MSEFCPTQAIKIAADDVSGLRKCDVFRVIDSTPSEHRPAVANYIRRHRPELSPEVSDVMEEYD